MFEIDSTWELLLNKHCTYISYIAQILHSYPTYTVQTFRMWLNPAIPNDVFIDNSYNCKVLVDEENPGFRRNQVFF